MFGQCYEFCRGLMLPFLPCALLAVPIGWINPLVPANSPVRMIQISSSIGSLRLTLEMSPRRTFLPKVVR